MFDRSILDGCRRHEAGVLQAWRDEQPPDEPLMRTAGGGGGGGMDQRTVKIISVQALVYTCSDFDDTGAPVGGTFDLYPKVFNAGRFITTGYDLRATTGTVVMEKFNAGEYFEIWTAPRVLRRVT